ncbi:DUF4157 domain-containing protein [Aerosakkonemataceae cyanobacterium BLCC-F50]|uniref:DUF4157 domain-containing protein n=1 Tax=Floridaenema flaviceps BLCC-F50 TaxID=3153642 RepID=A0ABV4XSU1_9CYAN
MTNRQVGRVNGQSKGETPLMSGVLQRAAVRAVADKEGEGTQEVESGRLSQSRFVHDFSQIPIHSSIFAKGIDASGEQKDNKTGLPDNLKAGIENLSGLAMDDVKVHYNSSKPSQLEAFAYTQGTNIYLGPSQEKYLPHEAWHAVQQKQRRVQPTLKVKGLMINDDRSLEQEADLLGGRAKKVGCGCLQRKERTGSDSISEKLINNQFSPVLKKANRHLEDEVKDLSLSTEVKRGIAIQMVQRLPARSRKSRYKQEDYRKSSKFRFIRWRRRILSDYTREVKGGINLFTVKYKKNGKSYYLTTRSVPSTNKRSFKLRPGHSEQRYQLISKQFEKRHKLSPQNIQWGATEREPCGYGSGMANCRVTLQGEGFPDNKIFFSSEYADREDMRSKPTEKDSELNTLASEHRRSHNKDHTENVKWLNDHYDSDSPSEDEGDVIDEYESDYGENPQPRKKKKNKKLVGAFRDGWHN